MRKAKTMPREHLSPSKFTARPLKAESAFSLRPRTRQMCDFTLETSTEFGYLRSIPTMSLFPCAAARCSGVSSPMFVVWTRAPRPISISTILVWPPFDAQCKGENWWSSLKGGQPDGSVKRHYQSLVFKTKIMTKLSKLPQLLKNYAKKKFRLRGRCLQYLPSWKLHQKTWIENQSDFATRLFDLASQTQEFSEKFV